jgi:flagellar basal body-associated protein FliL
MIIVGTIYGVFFHTSLPDPMRLTTSQKIGEGQTFTGIGRIRVSTADPQPGMVILFISFTYYPDDKAFSEELVLRVKDFRQIITNYFGSFSVSELQRLDEDSIKRELLRQFNAILRLGQIETLYFGDFMVVG